MTSSIEEVKDGKRKKQSLSKEAEKIHQAAFIFLLPVAILMVIYVFYPIADTFVTSLYKWNESRQIRLYRPVQLVKTAERHEFLDSI